MVDTMKATMEVAPETVTPVVPATEAAKTETPKPDLLTRVSQFKPAEAAPKVTPSNESAGNEFGLTAEDYDKVNKDPVLSKFYKSMQSGFGKKSQEIAEMRKSFEAEKAKLAELDNFTPDRVQQLLNRKDFVESAQIVAQRQAPKSSGMTDTEWSALSDSDKAKFQALENKMSSYEQLLIKERQEKEDAQLKTKYPDYAPSIIDTTVSKLLNGEVQATREDLHKVINYDKHIKETAEKAYQLGLQDAKLDLNDKRASSSPEGFSTTTPQDKVEPTKGESDSSFFKRITLNNLLKNRK